MRRESVMILLMTLCVFGITCSKKPQKDYPIKPVAFNEVNITDSFWLPRMETNREVTIPFAFKKCEETGRIDNFAKAAGLMEGDFKGKRYNDSDVYKIMEGAAYSLRLKQDPELEEYMDDLIAKVAASQEKDGYLYTTRTIDPKNPAPGAGEKRWSNLGSSHELYNVGHFRNRRAKPFPISKAWSLELTFRLIFSSDGCRNLYRSLATGSFLAQPGIRTFT